VSEPQLLVATVHRADCTFGGLPTEFFRIVFQDGTRLWRHNQEAVEHTLALVPPERVERVDRDGYCLDGLRVGDANTPDVVDAETWLGMPRPEAMSLVGLDNEAEYSRVYKQVQDAVYTRDNRESQGGPHVPIVIKKRGRPLTTVTLDDAS
jgi:hypothetical protein